MTGHKSPFGADKEPLQKAEFPMRINKYLAHKGYATRRDADELIRKGRVSINKKLAGLGDKVMENDVVEVRADKGSSQKKLVYFVYNKPQDVITHSPQDAETDIREMLPELVKEFNVFPVGRLDKDSHGLIILTNDGRIIDRLLNPDKEHEKEYVVHTKSKVRESFKEHAEQGITIEDYTTKPAKVRFLTPNSFAITITEGKKHQIRRMVAALFNEVTDLERIRVMNIKLNGIGSGKYRAIEGEELQTFLKGLGL
jgi:23S rRNA pseudouridine2604 synthase